MKISERTVKRLAEIITGDMLRGWQTAAGKG
jgi:hypothetical protein